MFKWQTRENRFKEMMYRGDFPLAAWINIPWEPLVEIFGACGLHGAIIDMEHTCNDFRDVERLIIACEAAGVTPIVRPPEINTHLVNRLLDSGALGIIFADVRSARDARTAVACTKYPPLGGRGWGGSHTRYAMWEGLPATSAVRETSVEGRGVYSNEYVNKANDDILTYLIVESPEGVDNVDEIAEVPGIDAISFGWADYSVQTGFDLETAEKGAARVYEACRKHGIGTSLSVGEIERGNRLANSYVICGIDTLILSGAVRRTMDDTRARIARA